MAVVISSALTLPFEHIQPSVPQLSKFTFHQIKKLWITALSAPPRITLPPILPSNSPPFTPIEDWSILASIRKNPKDPIQALMRDFAGFVPLTRDGRSLMKRVEELSRAPKAVKASIVSALAKSMCQEWAYDVSLQAHQESFPAQGPILPRHLPFLRSGAIFEREPPSLSPDCAVSPGDAARPIFDVDSVALAILRGERWQFAMKRRRVVIGFGGEADIRLVLVEAAQRTGCAKPLAVITLGRDCEFWLENIGQAEIAVNGKSIRSGKFGVLPHGAILDFAGTLGMLFVNRTLISRISGVLKRAERKMSPQDSEDNRKGSFHMTLRRENGDGEVADAGEPKPQPP
jgi:hypothetical protein